jgi:hypothetical protein
MSTPETARAASSGARPFWETPVVESFAALQCGSDS